MMEDEVYDDGGEDIRHVQGGREIGIFGATWSCNGPIQDNSLASR